MAVFGLETGGLLAFFATSEARESSKTAVFACNFIVFPVMQGKQTKGTDHRGPGDQAGHTLPVHACSTLVCGLPDPKAGL